MFAESFTRLLKNTHDDSLREPKTRNFYGTCVLKRCLLDDLVERGRRRRQGVLRDVHAPFQLSLVAVPLANPPLG